MVSSRSSVEIEKINLKSLFENGEVLFSLDIMSANTSSSSVKYNLGTNNN